MWCTDETLWPDDSSQKKFRDSFGVEFRSIVLDLFEDEIEKEPYEYVSTTQLPPTE
jgi:hypothetical protein